MIAGGETTLATLAGSDSHERLVVVLCQCPTKGSHLQLRQQNYAKGVGWFTQSTVAMEPHQVADLRAALGSTSNGASGRKASRLPKKFARVDSGHREDVVSFPRVVQADSA